MDDPVVSCVESWFFKPPPLTLTLKRRSETGLLLWFTVDEYIAVSGGLKYLQCPAGGST